MVLFKYVIIVVVAMVSLSYSGEVRIGQRFKRDTVSDVQKILDIIRAQDEKIDRLHTLVVTNQFLPRCLTALKTGNVLSSTKCWKDMINEIKTYDQSVTTESKLLGQLVTYAYDGEQARLLNVAEFIKNNVEKGSELANDGYKALLNAMDYYGKLYLNKIANDYTVEQSALSDYTYRTLIEIRKVEGEASPVFTQLLPSVVKSILSGEEVFIRNSVTKDFMYAPPDNSSGDDVTKILVNAGIGNDPRYLWRLKLVEFRWKDYNDEPFYIENTFENKILAVVEDGSLKLADPTEEKLRSTWAMFYIQLVQGSSGEEVAIQCSYWGTKTKTLGLDEEGKMLRLLSSDTLADIPTGIWLLQPKAKIVL